VLYHVYAALPLNSITHDSSLPSSCTFVQWGGMIAVNYPARAAGVKRGERAEAAIAKCPKIRLVHVDTIGAQDAPANDRSRRKIR
jgi:nucleotidyltransferase/DNA polymerase involved in DNA repair